MKKDYIRELPTFFLPNTGNMGIPICLFAYGKLGMGVAAAISSLVILLHFTANIFLAKRKFDFSIIAKSPSFYTIILTVIFLYYGKEMPVFVIATQDSSYEKIVSNIQEVKARKGKIIALVTQGDINVKKIADHYIEIPKCDELLVPLLATVPLQLLSYHIALLRECNVDQPRNLAKSVTVE